MECGGVGKAEQRREVVVWSQAAEPEGGRGLVVYHVGGGKPPFRTMEGAGDRGGGGRAAQPLACRAAEGGGGLVVGSRSPALLVFQAAEGADMVVHVRSGGGERWWTAGARCVPIV
jgi:hypothetical protein